MMQDHQEIFEEMMEEKGKKKRPKEPPAETISPTFPPKKTPKTVKVARAGGLMTASKRADGIAQRGKTKGRMV